MIFNPLTYTGMHTDISLIALITGLVVIIGMLRAERLPGWTALFIVTAVLTSVTGYGFKTDRLMPSHIVGAISLAVLFIAIVALYFFRLAGAWRWVYVASAMIAEFFLIFVAIAQSFAKIPSLHAMAPTGSEPPFAIAQGINLVIFIILGIWAARSFHPR
jgi:hypothetical protein